jgi:hypothetical protein
VAAEKGHMDIIRYLEDNGADIHVKDYIVSYVRYK